MRSTKICTSAVGVVLLGVCLGGASPVAAAPVIDTAQATGVAGFPIGVFGSGFGAAAGRLTILGLDATITRWSDSVIEAVVPRVADGSGSLVVVTGAGNASRPFVVYTVDPLFLAAPTRLDNLVYKKPAVISGTYSEWGAKSATAFLTYNDGGGAADLGTPSSVAVDLGAALTGPLWWSFFGSSDWYEYPTDNPRAYAIEGSADSTSGRDGTWVTLLAVSANDRASRTHPVQLTGQRWIRMRVSATTGGATYRLREVRAFRARAGDTARLDSLGVFGDSITTGDLAVTGPTAFYDVLRGLKGDGTQAITYAMGMVGQNTHVLLPSAASSDPRRALSVAIAMQPDIRYWGIALGTNDTNDTNFSSAVFRANLVGGIQQLLAAGKTPLLARLPDTAASGFGTAATKKAALAVIDELAATYRLIPGPDFYTPFRENLGTYLSDGTHHSTAGAIVENRLWAEALFRSGVYGAPAEPLPTLSIDNVTVTEGNAGTTPATFTVSLSAASGQTVSVAAATANGTATAGSDYTASSSTLTFAPGVTTRPFTLSVLTDRVHEADETFVVNLTAASGATIADAQGVGTILDDDPAGFSIGDVDVVEPASGSRNAVFTVTLAPTLASSATVSYATTAVTATAGSDFTAVAGTLTFAAGVSTRTISVPVLADALKEGVETFRVDLSNASGAAITSGAATGRIHDPGAFFTVTPCRLLDTRNAAGPYGGPALAAGQSRAFAISGRCGIPASARAVAVNVTVTGSTAAGNLRLFPSDVAVPTASALNYGAGQTRANHAIVGLSPTGGLSVRGTQASGTTQVILDVAGYFE